jgi:hypothetical protein
MKTSLLYLVLGFAAFSAGQNAGVPDKKSEEGGLGHVLPHMNSASPHLVPLEQRASKFDSKNSKRGVKRSKGGLFGFGSKKSSSGSKSDPKKDAKEKTTPKPTPKPKASPTPTPKHSSTSTEEPVPTNDPVNPDTPTDPDTDPDAGTAQVSNHCRFRSLVKSSMQHMQL